MQAAFLVVARAANSGGPGGPPGPLGLAIPYDSGPLPTESAGDLMEVAYHRPPWLSGSYHPRLCARALERAWAQNEARGRRRDDPRTWAGAFSHGP